VNTPYRILGLTMVISVGLMPPVFAGNVKAQTAKDADFPRYKTYQWLPPRVLTKLGIDENNPGNPALKEVVGRQLSQKGLNERADGADLLIQAYVLTEYVPQLEAVLLAVSPDLTYGTVIATMGRYNRDGTLVLNLIDSRTNKSAWSAMVTNSLPRGVLKPEFIRAQLDKAATQIFKKYPVKK
jgi:Domain of unknown function (DUF4136)